MQNTNAPRATGHGLFGGALRHAGLAVALAAPAGADPITFNQSTVASGLVLPTEIGFGDIDGDGRQDIVVGTEDGITWHKNDGGFPPAFSERDTFDLQSNDPTVMAVGDLNGDGFDDVVFSHDFGFEPLALRWLKNTGDPNDPFPPFESSMGPYLGEAVLSVALADIDGDGDLDILASQIIPDSVFWMENSGGANPFFSTRTVDNSLAARSVAVGHIDADEHPDLVVGTGDGGVAWFQSDGASTPSFTRRDLAPVSGGRISVATGDADGDGDLDIFFGDFGFFPTGDNAGWFENNNGTPPTFSGPQFFSVDTRRTARVMSTDLDGDGDQDMVGLSIGSTDSIRWWDNDGQPDPTFTERTIAGYSAGTLGFAFAAADADNDGDLDLAALINSSDQARWFENTADPAPVITFQPFSVFATAPATVGLTVIAESATFYQWKRNGQDLSNDGVFIGTDTPSITIEASLATQGVYTCVVGNAFGTVTTFPAVLGVEAAPSACLGDLNGDGTTDVFDFAEFAFDFGCVTP